MNLSIIHIVVWRLHWVVWEQWLNAACSAKKEYSQQKWPWLAFHCSSSPFKGISTFAVNASESPTNRHWIIKVVTLRWCTCIDCSMVAWEKAIFFSPVLFCRPLWRQKSKESKCVMCSSFIFSPSLSELKGLKIYVKDKEGLLWIVYWQCSAALWQWVDSFCLSYTCYLGIICDQQR